MRQDNRVDGRLVIDKYKRANLDMRAKKEKLCAMVIEKQSFLDSLLKVPANDTVRVMGGERSDPTGKAAVNLVDFHDTRIKRLNEQINHIWCEIDILESEIASAGLTEQEREYLDCVCCKFMQTKDIAAKWFCSDKNVRRIKAIVIDKLSTEIAFCSEK